MRLIDADDFIERFSHTPMVQEAIRKAMDKMPTIEPERKKGKWIVYYECPKCGEITKDFTEYCPFCSADMRGEDDE